MMLLATFAVIGLVAVGVAGCNPDQSTLQQVAQNPRFTAKAQAALPAQAHVPPANGAQAPSGSTAQSGPAAHPTGAGQGTNPASVSADRGPTEAEIGLPFYPDSVAEPGPTGLRDSTRGRSLGMVSAALLTDASPQHVIHYYKRLFPAGNRTTPAGREHVAWRHDGPDHVHMTLDGPDAASGLRTIEISPKDGKTRIRLTSISLDIATPPATTPGTPASPGHASAPAPPASPSSGANEPIRP